MTALVGRRLASGSFLRVVDFTANAVVAFFMMPFVVRSLGDRMYGFWTLVATFLGYYGLLDFGLSSAVHRHIGWALGAGDREKSGQVFNTALLLYSVLGLAALVVTGVLAALAPVICRSPQDASLFWRVILILGVSNAIGFPLRTFGGVLAAQLRYDIMSALELVSLFVRTALVVWVVASGHGVLALAWVTFLSGIPSSVLCVYFSKRSLPGLRFSLREWRGGEARRLLSYSSFAFIAQVADRLRFHVDAFVIMAFVSLSAVTHYNVAAMLSQYFIGFVVAFMGVFQGVFSWQHGAGDRDAMRKTFFFATKLSVCISAFVGFGLIVWGKPFIERWMGRKYLDAYPCLVFLVAGCLCALSQNPSVSLLFSTAKHRFYALFNSIEGVANLLLSIALVHRFGIVGVAFGTFLPMVIMKLVIQPIYVCRVSSISYLDYARVMARTLGAVCLSLSIPLLVSLRYAAPDYRVLGAVGLASAGSYSLMMWLVAFTGKERHAIRQGIVPAAEFRGAAVIG